MNPDSGPAGAERAVPRWPIPWRYPLAILLAGVAAGAAGALLDVLLHGVEQLVYGYRASTFLYGVTHAAPAVRLAALAGAGVLGGVGWFALRRWGAPSVSVEEAISGRRLPTRTTIADAALQIATVGLGASIGRELAPRLVAAAVADRIAAVARLDRRQRGVVIAAAAGAGLAAIYNVPLGGALFTLEVLLADLRIATVLAACAASAVATLVARIAVPDPPVYVVHPGPVNASLLGWSVVAGPPVGAAAITFRGLTTLLRRHRPTGWRLLVALPVVCGLVGLVGTVLPEVLGNGRALGQFAVAGGTTSAMLLLLAAAKFAATSATIGAGANGGTLTPSVSIGAALGAATAGCWAAIWPGIDPAGAAVCGAAAFLAVTMRAPITALVLTVELTAAPVGLMIPLLIVITTASATDRFAGHAFAHRIRLRSARPTARNRDLR